MRVTKIKPEKVAESCITVQKLVAKNQPCDLRDRTFGKCGCSITQCKLGGVL